MYSSEWKNPLHSSGTVTQTHSRGIPNAPMQPSTPPNMIASVKGQKQRKRGRSRRLTRG